jgi:hypothetical protein
MNNILVGDARPVTNDSTCRLGSFNVGCAYNKLFCKRITNEIKTTENARNFFIP